MAAPPFGFQQQLDSGLLQKLADSGNNTGWGPIVQQLMGAVQQGVAQSQQNQRNQQFQQMISQLMGNGEQMQGPQMPTGPAIKGPQGYVPPGAGPMAVPAGQSPMPQNPQSGMGAPPPPFNGVDPGKLLGVYMQVDPQGANDLIGKMLSGKMAPPQMNPLQQSEIMKNQATTQNLLRKPAELQASLDEKKVEADANRQLRLLTAQTNALLQQGRIDEAKALAAQRDEMQKMILQNKVDSIKGQHWVANMLPWSATAKLKGPLDRTSTSGLSPQEQAELDRLNKKFGGQQ